MGNAGNAGAIGGNGGRGGNAGRNIIQEEEVKGDGVDDVNGVDINDQEVDEKAVAGDRITSEQAQAEFDALGAALGQTGILHLETGGYQRSNMKYWGQLLKKYIRQFRLVKNEGGVTQGLLDYAVNMGQYTQKDVRAMSIAASNRFLHLWRIAKEGIKKHSPTRSWITEEHLMDLTSKYLTAMAIRSYYNLASAQA